MLSTYMSVICLKNSLALVITSWPYLNWKMWSTNFGIYNLPRGMHPTTLQSHTKPIMSILWWTCHSYCCSTTKSGNFCMSAWLSHCLPLTIACTCFNWSEPERAPHYETVLCIYVCVLCICMYDCLWPHTEFYKLYYVLQAISKCLQNMASQLCICWLRRLHV